MLGGVSNVEVRSIVKTGWHWQLALAIQQAAQLVKDEAIASTTIAAFLESFKEHKKTLPARVSGDRSDIVHSLDSLWNMTFTNLSRNARHLLSVLSLLSPGNSRPNN
jgi:hypothetical protein